MTPLHTLGPSERIKSQKIIERLFREGKSQFHYPFKLVYLNLDASSVSASPLQFAVSVPKRKIRSAVKRNLLKRRCREAYRQNKSELSEKTISTGMSIALMFIFIGDEAKKYSVIEKSIKKHLNDLSKKIHTDGLNPSAM